MLLQQEHRKTRLDEGEGEREEGGRDGGRERGACSLGKFFNNSEIMCALLKTKFNSH